MSTEKRFYCHNRYQEFEEYTHKTGKRVYFFGKCKECGKYFYLKDGEIIEGRKAKEWYKDLRKYLTKVVPVIKFLKHLCFGVSARKTKTIYARDENDKIMMKNIFQIDGKGEIELDKDGNPIIASRQKVVKSRIITEYQLVKINNRGKLETITNTINLGLMPRTWEEKELITA